MDSITHMLPTWEMSTDNLKNLAALCPDVNQCTNHYMLGIIPPIERIYGLLR